MKQLLSVVMLFFAFSGSAWSADAPAVAKDGILVDKAGMTLYTFDKDQANSGKSACNGGCAKAWPPLTAQPDAKPEGKLSVITRDDGTKQWAHDGKPLYLYQSDQKPGDRSGDKFKDIWHVIPQ